MDISTNDPFGEPATRVPIDATFDFVNVGHVSAHRFRAWVKSIAVYSFPEDRIIGTENPLPTGIERPLVLPPPASSLYQPIDRNRVPEWGFQFSDKIKHLITDQDVVLEVDIGISYNDGYKEVNDHICYAHMHIRGAPRANKVGVVEMFGESYETISCDSVSDRIKNLWALENSKSD